eukprot:2234821-Amphidinium_carterae.1
MMLMMMMMMLLHFNLSSMSLSKLLWSTCCRFYLSWYGPAYTDDSEEVREFKQSSVGGTTKAVSPSFAFVEAHVVRVPGRPTARDAALLPGPINSEPESSIICF